MKTDTDDGLRSRLWPLFDLRLSTARLTLRLPTEAEALQLADVAPADLETDPSWPAPSGVDEPTATAVLQGYWRALGQWKVDNWALPFGVWFEERPIGFQVLEGERFGVVRSVETASWLTPAARGSGLGKEMRAAVLTLAFDHLGAARAKSGAWEWNEASLGVSRSLGYVDNGWDFEAHGDMTGVMRNVMLEKADWDGAPWETTVEGLEPCVSWFGATASGTPAANERC